MWPVAMVMVVINIVTVEPRVERSEHILMGTAGTMLDWVLKKKVSFVPCFTFVLHNDSSVPCS